MAAGGFVMKGKDAPREREVAGCFGRCFFGSAGRLPLSPKIPSIVCHFVRHSRFDARLKYDV
jgi:hypothetical protein